MKNWLRKPPPATSIEGTQTQLEHFGTYCNTIRPHRSIDRRTPDETYNARNKAIPAGTDRHWRIREDRIDESGVVTLRYDPKLHYIGIVKCSVKTPAFDK